MPDNYLYGLFVSSSNLAITGSCVFHLNYFIKSRNIGLREFRAVEAINVNSKNKKHTVSATDLKTTTTNTKLKENKQTKKEKNMLTRRYVEKGKHSKSETDKT